MPTPAPVTPTSLCRGSRSDSRGYRVTVQPTYLPDQSDPLLPRYTFAYRITIENTSGPVATLRSRRWTIIDAHGRGEEVEGDGVVGQQPRLRPGDTFTYESFCPLRTRWGTMEGSYRMAGDDGERFEIPIARFLLAVPTDPAADR